LNAISKAVTAHTMALIANLMLHYVLPVDLSRNTTSLCVLLFSFPAAEQICVPFQPLSILVF